MGFLCLNLKDHEYAFFKITIFVYICTYEYGFEHCRECDHREHSGESSADH